MIWLFLRASAPPRSPREKVVGNSLNSCLPGPFHPARGNDAAAPMSETQLRYDRRGVSATKSEVHAAIASQSKGLFPGAFCKVLPDLFVGDPKSCVLMHADTAGTKASLAYLAWREGFGDAIWRGVAQDALVMNLDDCGCVGCRGPFVVSNTIGRNAKRIPGAVLAQVVEGYQRMCDLLTAEGVPCSMAGGETADVGDLVRTIDVGCTVCARMPRSLVIDASRIQAGDVLIGFASHGQARWEDAPNSGIGSNGLTSARHELLRKEYLTKYPETFAPEIDQSVAYCGSWSVHDPLPGDERFTVGSALLSPTRTFLPLIRRIIEAVPAQDLHAIIHCTGGGQTKIGKFGHGLRYVKDRLLTPPAIFRLLASKTSSKEAWQVFNMGIRLEVAVPERQVAAILDRAREARIEAQVTGRVEALAQEGQTTTNEVVVHADGQQHVYRFTVDH